MQIGARYLGDGHCEFTVWSPAAETLAVKIVAPGDRLIPMKREERGYWRVTVDEVEPGTLYFYQIDDGPPRPDPASCYQPQGVHNPSQVIDHGAFTWTDGDWRGVPLEELLIYELHVGSFTPEGTFEAIIPRLPELRELGITAVEIMPVAQFPGSRNWGYDGVHIFAVQNSYGGPEGLKRLVDACHQTGLSLILDVVYNHFGPEGCYVSEFGPYFTEAYRCPWGAAVNLDGRGSDEVRNFFLENALHWFRHYHIDALRLDAIDRLYDFSALPFMQQLAERVRDFNERQKYRHLLIAETDHNDVRLLRPLEEGGYGIDAQWCDDFHHSLHALLTGEDVGYYADFGAPSNLVQAYREGYVYDGRYSKYRDRHRGSSSRERPGKQFCVFSQNHDQVGNRMFGHRLISLTSFEGAKVAAAAVLFSPFIPLLFMGEEYGEEAPFLYFVDHIDQELNELVRVGRREEFRAFLWRGDPPDPADAETFRASTLNWDKRHQGKNRVMLEFYGRLIAMRQELPALRSLDKDHLAAHTLEKEKVLWLRRWKDTFQVLCLFNFSREENVFEFPAPAGDWHKLLDSAEVRWRGPGDTLPKACTGGTRVAMPPFSCALYQEE
jgi:maltooligosyltrehalose trehalohydrolase